jgi:DNA-binding LacI/PurR family transcriptional regulator
VAVDEDTIVELRAFEQEGGILLCYDRSFEIACDQVIFDREDNTYQAARHLLYLGRWSGRLLGLDADCGSI